jgi:fructokinase
MVDPNVRLSAVPDPARWTAAFSRLLPRADIVKASSDDLAVLHPGVTLVEAARRIRAEGPALVVVTDGPRPILVSSPTGESLVDAPSVEVTDTIGAGDTFSGALLGYFVQAGVDRVRLREAGELAAAVWFALRASAAVCQRVGADPPTIVELGGWPLGDGA